ncbi:copper-binding protein [Polaromonas sp.]|uniref:copper-binding protein n=1 Tax=Polaromonas sp. TaxID=1869339 RepID=UPI00185675F4|nr:copper-binding protein [Polaromonas sp.]NML87007.1 copper-binding protein [Polaromonas sp.]
MKPVQVIGLIAFAASAMLPAQGGFSANAAGPVKKPAAGSRAMASAEVLKVYKNEKRLLLQHGPIENLRMEAMTMEFGVSDQKLLDSVKQGDKIRFVARRVGDDYIVTHLKLMK